MMKNCENCRHFVRVRSFSNGGMCDHGNWKMGTDNKAVCLGHKRKKYKRKKYNIDTMELQYKNNEDF